MVSRPLAANSLIERRYALSLRLNSSIVGLIFATTSRPNRPRWCARLSQCRVSYKEPRAFRIKRRLSTKLPRPVPSAMLAPMLSAARTSCLPTVSLESSPNLWPLSKSRRKASRRVCRPGAFQNECARPSWSQFRSWRLAVHSLRSSSLGSRRRTPARLTSEILIPVSAKARPLRIRLPTFSNAGESGTATHSSSDCPLEPDTMTCPMAEAKIAAAPRPLGCRRPPCTQPLCPCHHTRPAHRNSERI